MLVRQKRFELRVHCLGPPCRFHQVEVHHFNRPKLSNNSLIRDQKSNKHIANGYKKLVHTFKREAVQFFCGKKPCRKSLTAGSPSFGSNVNCKLQTCPQGRGHVTFCGLPFAVSHEKPDAKGPYYLSTTASFFSSR